MNTLYSVIEQAIRSFATSVEVPNTSTENDIYMTIRQVMRENPDIRFSSHTPLEKSEQRKQRSRLRKSLKRISELKKYVN